MSVEYIYKLASKFEKMAQETSADGMVTNTIPDNFQKVIDSLKDRLNVNIGKILNSEEYGNLFPAGEFKVSVSVVGQTPTFKLRPESPLAEEILNKSKTVAGLVTQAFQQAKLNANEEISFNNILKF